MPERKTRVRESSAVAVLLATAAGLCAAEPLTLERALDRALEGHPSLAVSAAALELSKARLSQSRRLPDPELSIEAENVLAGGEYSGFDSAETTVSITQPLPFARRSASVRASRAALDAAALDAQLQRTEIVRALTETYAKAIAARRLASIAAQRARAAATLRDAVQRRVVSGLDPELRLAQVEIESALSEAAAVRAGGDATAARRALFAFWSGEDGGELLDEAWFERMPLLPPTSIPSQADSSTLQARVAEARLVAAEAAVERARAERWPEVVATLGARRFAAAPSGDDRALVLAISLPLPLWNRGAAGIAEARLELARARLELTKVLREARDERDRSRAELAGALREVQALQTVALPAALRASELAERGYAAGRLTLAERVEADRRLWELQESLEQARGVAHQAHARLTAVTPASP